MPSGLLSEDEAKLWHAWKRAGEAVMNGVARDIAEGTGLSGADFGVLSRLADLGPGELRQQDLAESMRWDKSRLSHQLTRMQNRGFITRRPADGRGIIVVMTPAGRKALAPARGIHARSVQRHLVAKLTAAKRKVLLAICERLRDADAAQATQP
jgi:DNA-binding MarR family transcriptional regulator